MRVLFVQHQGDDPPGLVGERLAELGARLDVADPRHPLPDPAGYQLIVPLGSADSVADSADPPPYLAAEWELLARGVRAGVPVFGICFGAQLLCRVLGGAVVRMACPEVGWFKVDPLGPDPIAAGPWLQWHHDGFVPPPGSELAAGPASCQAYQVGRALGVQFHPEVTPEAVASWARADAATVERFGVDVDGLLARMRADAADTRQRVAELVEWVLGRIVEPPRQGVRRLG